MWDLRLGFSNPGLSKAKIKQNELKILDYKCFRRNLLKFPSHFCEEFRGLSRYYTTLLVCNKKLSKNKKAGCFLTSTIGDYSAIVEVRKHPAKKFVDVSKHLFENIFY